MKKIYLCLLILIAYQPVESQEKSLSSVTATVQTVLESKISEWQLTESDISEITISSYHTSKHNQVTHVYVQQMIGDVPIYNAIVTLNIKNDRLIHGQTRFIPDARSKIANSAINIQPASAVQSFAKSEGVKGDERLVLLKSNADDWLYQKPSYALNDIPVRKTYVYTDQNELRLAWSMEVHMKSSLDYWNARIDVATGQLLSKNNYTTSCHFGSVTGSTNHTHHENCDEPAHVHSEVHQRLISAGDGASYRVYPFPTESPIHGSQQLIQEPADPEASPYGWHDVDGFQGPEFLYTRGNNVHAFVDKNADDTPDGAEPGGGEELVFDFDNNLLEEPDSNLAFITTNLFYGNNFMHDFAYRFGFDEEAGNFQANNYDNGGSEGDAVQATALDGFGLEGDDQTIGNARFTTPGDGGRGAMLMFAWQAPGQTFLAIESPEAIAGNLDAGRANGWGQNIGTTPINGTVALMNDGVGNKSDGCTPATNSDDLRGKIVLIDRGVCEFGTKALNAQEAGAIGVVVCNVPGVNGGSGEETINMGAGADGSQVTIPVLSIGKANCDAIKTEINRGGEVELRFQLIPPPEGPNFFPSSLDNGVVAHEYGHGISNRLTGGRFNSGCLSSDEQMGEGWSDFFTLVTTHEPGDRSTDPRGIGNYLVATNTEGRGIRRRPYTTDMSLNGFTLEAIQGTSGPHSVGEVWTLVLWDMYWAFVDLYGFDSTWEDRNSGNFRAVQLVMDGMKFQGCAPGFDDARDGIIAAEEALYNGEHSCMIWSVFSERGMGFNADQGSIGSRNDNVQNFETLPTCVEELKIQKAMTSLIDPGDDIQVTLSYQNHKKNALDAVVITDLIPDGTSYVAGSANASVNVTGTELEFDLGSLASLAEGEITYTLQSSASFESTVQLQDDFENDSPTLVQFPIEGGTEWQLTQEKAFSGTTAWHVADIRGALDQGLSTSQALTITGERPVLKFRHFYDTRPVEDGGIVEVSTDNGQVWEVIPAEAFIRNGYNSVMSFQTFAIPSLKGFSGINSGWIDSFIDLSAYIGQPILIRFRYGSLDTDSTDTTPPNTDGWYIDDLEFIDIVSYDGSEACISSNSGDSACDDALVLVNSMIQTPTNEVVIEQQQLNVFPNPTEDELNISFLSSSTNEGFVKLYTVDGQLVISNPYKMTNGLNVTNMDLSQLTNGMYVLRIESREFVVSQKIMKSI